MFSLSYLQAIVIGLLQGVTELFPISSLGHSVLVPAFLGGSWESLVTSQAQSESPYLAFIVALHVATALALIVIFWRDWVALVGAFFATLRHRRIATADERMIWLIIIATIPAGIIGLAFEHSLRTLFAKPEAAAIFLTVNGVILLTGERLRQRASNRVPVPAGAGGELEPAETISGDEVITRDVRPRDAVAIGFAQSLALLAGISRSGVTMVAGLLRGLDHERAIRFSFLLATPVILAAGLYKIPDLLGPLGDGIRGQALAGAAAAFVAAYFSARFLSRWFKTRTLTPFAVYCLVVGPLAIVYFA